MDVYACFFFQILVEISYLKSYRVYICIAYLSNAITIVLEFVEFHLKFKE